MTHMMKSEPRRAAACPGLRAGIPAAAFAGLLLAGCSTGHIGETWQCPLAEGGLCDSVAAADPAVPDRRRHARRSSRSRSGGSARTNGPGLHRTQRRRARRAAARSIPSPGWRGCSMPATPGRRPGQVATGAAIAATPWRQRAARRRRIPRRPGPRSGRRRHRRRLGRNRRPGSRSRQPPPLRPKPARRGTSLRKTSRTPAICAPARWWRGSGSRPSSTRTASTARRVTSASCWSPPSWRLP